MLKVKNLLVFVCLILITFPVFSQKTLTKLLSGTDKDHTVAWEFFVSGGRNSGQWSTIPVPSNWEMQGFGTYHYWSDWADGPAPDSIGNYRHHFTIPAEWEGKQIDIVFGGVMTDAEVKVNGKSAGPIHQGGFYEFRYNITDLLNYGRDNLLEVEVHRFSSNTSINLAERRADFWMFSGIYRPVWLEAFPQQHIVRTAIDATHTGAFSIDVYLDGISTADKVVVQIKELSGKPVGPAFSAPVKSGQKKVRLTSQLKDIKPWSAEWPNRYKVHIALRNNNHTFHEIADKFGFRTIEVREHDGIYVNNKKVMLKGVNRHSFWPTSGRTTSKALSIMDINLIKDMNMNAVRMSHYPPDKHFLAVADSLGLYVIDELTGWQDEYDTEVGEKLVRELVIRDVNHPSIILWANGNEGGFNFDLDDDFALYDPQKRTVIHPWANFNGINTAHYEKYDCCTGSFFHGDDIFMPTEFLHGLYDGGHGAGLDDWWNLMLQNPLAAGGFLWDFADEGIVRTDQKGTSDVIMEADQEEEKGSSTLNEIPSPDYRSDQKGKIDVAGNSAPDGIVGPFREKEGSFFAIKEIWSPVYFEISNQDNLPPAFNGQLTVENRYDHTNLNQVNFSWELVDFPTPGSGKTGHRIATKGTAKSPDVSPNRVGRLSINLPSDWSTHDAFYLTATDPHDREIYTWTWMIPEPDKIAQNIVEPGSGKVKGKEMEGLITMEANGTVVQIDKSTGLLHSVTRNGEQIPLSQGPRLVSGEANLKEIAYKKDGDTHVVEAVYDGNLKKIHWRMLPNGWLKLSYAYQFDGGKELDYMGVTFDYPEEKVTDMRWLGKGPYRVWKNRLKGAEFDVWHKAYNNTMTGLSWEYPEFKGFHGNMYWATLETKEVPVTMVVASDNIFLRLFTPEEPEGKAFDPKHTDVDFPAGDISFLHGIAPIGTKFHTAAEHGPAGQRNQVPRLGKWFEGTVYFYFGEIEEGNK